MSISIQNILFVFAGGAIGTAMRWAVGAGSQTIGVDVIAALVAVNVVGSFALGWFVVDARSARHHVNALFAVGVLGSFTTFSGYTVATVELFESGTVAGGLALAFGSVLVGFVAAIIGRQLGQRR